MKRHFILLLILLVGGLTACGPGNKKNRSMETETKLKIETSAGDIVVIILSSWPRTELTKGLFFIVSLRTL